MNISKENFTGGRKQAWANDIGKRPLDQPDIVNFDVINNSIENILMTSKGSRLFNINFGSTLESIIFENVSETSMQNALLSIIDDIELWEDRILIDRGLVSLNINVDTHIASLVIPYIIKNIGVQGTFTKRIIN